MKNRALTAVALGLTLFAITEMAAVRIAEAIELTANLRLFGEVERFGLGYGDMPLHFGVNVPAGSLAPQIGSLGFVPGGIPYATGALSAINLATSGFTVVDTEFSIPFSLEIGQPASLYIGLGDNGIGGVEGGSVQVIFDFSDNIWYQGSILGQTGDQGFGLTSVTLANGESLSSAGLSFDFIGQNTVLFAAASAFDRAGTGLITSTTPGIENGQPTRAAVFNFPGTATSKLYGGPDFSGIPTENFVDLDVSPEADPFVYDIAGATISGADNILLTRTTQPAPVPEPGTILLWSLGIAIVGATRSGSKRLKAAA